MLFIILAFLIIFIGFSIIIIIQLGIMDILNKIDQKINDINHKIKN
jgi:hypothetical protein